MSDTSHLWTRRQFSQALAASATISLLSRPAHSTPASKPSSHAPPEGFAYIASNHPSATAAGAIHILRTSNSAWTPIGSIHAEAPIHLAKHPVLPVLYAVHHIVLWQHLPRGAVSAYTIAPDGHLTHRNTQPLSLAATLPRHAAVSPNGRLLIVAVEGAGIYNLLPIHPDGSLAPVLASRKELGSLIGAGPQLPAPHTVLFHPDSARFLAFDPIQQSLSLFTLDGEAISLTHRTPTAGVPSQILLCPSGDHLYTRHAASGLITVHRIGTRALHLEAHLHTPTSPGPHSMAIHPSGHYLVAASRGTLTTLSLMPPRQTTLVTIPHIHTLTFDPPGTHLVALTTSNTILQIPFAPVSGHLGEPHPVTHIKGATSTILQTT